MSLLSNLICLKLVACQYFRELIPNHRLDIEIQHYVKEFQWFIMTKRHIYVNTILGSLMLSLGNGIKLPNDWKISM